LIKRKRRVGSVVCYSLLVLVTVFVFSIDSFADASEEESIPASAYVAYINPYYFSDFGFGVYSLDYLGVSKKPYLTEGLDDNSDLDEIVRAYEKATEHLGQKNNCPRRR